MTASRICASAIGAMLGVLAAFAVLSPTKTSVGETSCSQLIHNFVTNVAKANDWTLTSERLLACHQTGNTSVARVEISFTENMFDPFTMRPYSEKQTITVVVDLSKSVWQITNARQVG